MPKVRTLSRTFMKGHPRAGEPTYFPEKFAYSLGIEKDLFGLNPKVDFSILDEPNTPTILGLENFFRLAPKHHTVRMGRHFKPIDELTLAIWSGKPYRTKQIKLWTGSIRAIDIFIESRKNQISIFKDLGKTIESINIYDVAKNDGLSFDDFKAWFNLPTGTHLAQILIWNPEINYKYENNY